MKEIKWTSILSEEKNEINKKEGIYNMLKKGIWNKS